MEEQIRLRAFQWLEEQTTIHGEVLSRDLLQHGFLFEGQRIALVGPQGIFKPRMFQDTPISVTTAPGGGPYHDEIRNHLLHYQYRGTDPFHRDNAGLRNAMNRQVPLIYFLGILPGKYLPVWPVYIIEENRETLSFVIATDMPLLGQRKTDRLGEEPGSYVAHQAAMRKYSMVTVRQRVHQGLFRERVLNAYQDQCAFCRLRHRELLDAAHIIPDSEEEGEPLVSNGLSLCKIHHAAFDQFFIGVTPEYQVIVRKDILEEQDGPMLLHGIQRMHKSLIILPRAIEYRPDKDKLNEKYVKFLEHNRMTG